jgi:hypothetical protein
MSNRTVTDSAGRVWTCTSQLVEVVGVDAAQGQDVILDCVTPSVDEPVRVTVGWQWEKMAPAGLARMISLQSPAPRV